MMKSVNYFISFIFTLLVWFLPSCQNNPQKSQTITVTIEPQRFFAEKIAKDKFHIQTMVPAGQSPENYEPTPNQMIQLGQCKAYFKIGYIGFEKAWMKNISENNPQMQLFDLSQGMSLLKNEVHSHETEGLSEEETDPHIWNSIEGARVISLNLLKAFIQLDPQNEKFYQENYTELLKEIDQVEKRIKEYLSSIKNRTFIIYHPALTYFAKEFNLHQLCIEMDGKEPSPAQLKSLIDTARNNNAKVVFIQKEFDSKNAKLISQETNCQLISINPLNYNWEKEMIQIAKALCNGETN